MEYNDRNFKKLEEFFYDIDKDFPISLSSKQNLNQFISKVILKADIFVCIENNEIVGLVCGYITNSINTNAYLSVLGVKKQYRKRGYAHILIEEFINKCKLLDKKNIYLYTHKSNKIAIKLYKNFHFQLEDQNERENDCLLVLRMEEI